MTLPSIILGLICSLLIGSIFHLLVDGGLGRFFLYLGLSLLGFAVGQWVGISRNWMLMAVGSLDLGLATLGSLLFLGLGYWLGNLRLESPSRKDKV